MLNLVLLIYIGIQINAASWYFWICAALGLLRIVQFGLTVYKKGKERGED